MSPNLGFYNKRYFHYNITMNKILLIIIPIININLDTSTLLEKYKKIVMEGMLKDVAILKLCMRKVEE